MPIGLGAQTPGGQHLDIVHSMAATWCLGPLSDSRPCPGPVLKLNTVGWQMRLLRVAGFVNYFMSLVMVRGSPLLSSVFCDNVSAVYMASNPVHRQRTKHIEIYLHFVRDKVSLWRGPSAKCAIIKQFY
jgi:hypothetical protein